MEFKYKQVVFRLPAFLTLVILLLTATTSFAQHDSLVFKNGNVIVGEIKSMDKGVITIETGYSKSDFTIEWKGLKEIYAKSRFLISLKDGRRLNGTFHSIDSANKIIIEGAEGQQQATTTTLEDVVYLKGLKSDFWSRVTASIDIGLSVTKANNVRQFNANTALGYFADKWKLNLYYSDIRSKQDNVDLTKRVESGIDYNYFLPKDWYVGASITTLSNTEQALKLRLTGKLGGGKYLIHTNKAYWGLGGGLSFNRETFTNDTEERSSLEGYFGTEANFFDVGDFSFFSNLYVYPGITESGRWRTDFKTDAKYEFPHDIYIKFNFTINYDNRPAVVGNETDYVYGFSVGWKL